MGVTKAVRGHRRGHCEGDTVRDTVKGHCEGTLAGASLHMAGVRVVRRTSAITSRPSSVKLFSSSEMPERLRDPRSNSACGKGNAPSALRGKSKVRSYWADHCRRVCIIEADRVQQDGLQRLAVGHSDKRLRTRQACVWRTPLQEHGGCNTPRACLILNRQSERCELSVARQVECRETRIRGSNASQQLSQLFSRVDDDALRDSSDTWRRRGSLWSVECAHERCDTRRDLHAPGVRHHPPAGQLIFPRPLARACHSTARSTLARGLW